MYNSVKECIIIFTKDRPQKLSKIIKQLIKLDKIDIIIIDDSVSKLAKEINSKLCNVADNIHYHGKDEQKELLRNLKSFKLENFIEPLGARRWHLGFIRNYAIILTKSLRYEKVLFVDDDIIFRDITIIKKVVSKLNDFDFVGAKILGSPDYSIIDNITDECGQKLELCNIPCGGFLGFNLNVISEYFLDYYNEDLLWIYLHPYTSKIYCCEEVYQQSQGSSRDLIKEALWQEFGEILFEGAHKSFQKNNFSLLTRNNFWNKVLQEETRYVKKLGDLCREKNIKNDKINILKQIELYILRLTANNFIKVFIEYFKKRKSWRNILLNLYRA